MNKEIIELPDNVFKCAACCVDSKEGCNCGDNWHYEEKK